MHNLFRIHWSIVHTLLILDLLLIHLSFKKLLTQTPYRILLLPVQFLNKYKINKQCT